MPLSAKRVLRTFKYAMYFNGVDAYVSISNSVSLRLDNSISILSWVYPLVSYTPSFGFISRQDGYCSHSFYIGPYSRYFSHTYYDGSAWVGYTYNVYIYGRWVHLASTFSFPTMIGYLNGSQVITITLSKPPRTKPQNANVYICGYIYGEYWLRGYMAQLLIYSRALSVDEIKWNYQYPDNPVKNGLVLWLQADPAYIKDIDGDGVLEWIDLSGYGNHGKIYGAQLVQLIKTPTRTITPYRVSSPKRVLEAVR